MISKANLPINFALTLILAICVGCGSTKKQPLANSTVKEVVTQDTQKVIVVFLENEGFDNAMTQPYLSQLSKQGALLTNYHGVTQRSLPNYIAFVAGDTFGIVNDSPVSLDQRNISDLLEEHGKTWKVYAEDYPGACQLKTRFKQYHRKQNPLINFKGIQESAKRCENIVNADQFKADLINNNSLSDFTMYVPNQINNGHDSDVKTASLWLKKFLTPILSNQDIMKNTLVVIVFDENFFPGKRNNIYAVMLGKNIRPGSVSDITYNHYNMLKTLEKYLDIGTLGRHDAKADMITGIWQNE